MAGGPTYSPTLSTREAPGTRPALDSRDAFASLRAALAVLYGVVNRSTTRMMVVTADRTCEIPPNSTARSMPRSPSGLNGTMMVLPGPGSGDDVKNKNLLRTRADPSAYLTLARPLSAWLAYPPAFEM